MRRMTKKYLTDLTYQITGAAIEVHREIGPGLTERPYHKCMERELEIRGLSFKSELIVEIPYKGIIVDDELRCDILVENAIVVELKSVKELLPIHDAQTINYAKLLKKPKAILINFNVINIYKEGQRTFVTEYYYDLPEY